MNSGFVEFFSVPLLSLCLPSLKNRSERDARQFSKKFECCDAVYKRFRVLRCIFTLNKQTIRILAIIAVIVFHCHLTWAQTTIALKPQTIKNIEGYTGVQDIFGFCKGNMDSRFKPYIRDARITAIRQIINWIPNQNTPGLGFKYPSWSKNTPRFDTKQESYEWYDGFLRRDPDSLWNRLMYEFDFFDSNVFGTKNVTISGNPHLYDGRLERDLDAAIKNVDAYIQALKNHIPSGSESRLQYFQLANEPENQPMWAGQFNDDQKETAASYFRMYNAMYDSIKKSHPDVIMVGPCIGHMGAMRLQEPVSMPDMNWYTWVKGFIDHVKNPQALKYIDSQHYSVPILRDLAFTSMTQNYADNTRGVRPRLVITEIGAPFGCSKCSRAQFKFLSESLFMMLQNPDKYALRASFLAGGSSNNHALYKIIDGKCIPQSRYWVFLALKNLRGKNIHFNSDNPLIRTFAAAPSGDKLVVGLFNYTSQNQPVTLNTGLTAGDISSITHRKAVWNNPGNNADYSDSNIEIGSSIQLSLEPISTHAIEISLQNPITNFDTLKIKEYYGSVIDSKMDAPQDVYVDLPVLPTDTAKAFLRVAFHKQPRSGDFQMQLNGNTYRYNLSALPDRVIENDWFENVGFIDIPIDIHHLTRNNKISLDSLDDNRLLFVSLIIKNPHIQINDKFCLSNDPPSIDGIEGDAWQYVASDSLKHILKGFPVSKNDLSASYKAKWDSESLYFLVTVQDDTLINDSGDRPLQDDAIEVYINGNNDTASAFDANDHCYIFRWNDANVYARQDTAQPDNPDGVTFAQNTNPVGYTMEIKIDWNAIGIEPKGQQLIGFELQVTDDDSGGEHDKKVAWNAQASPVEENAVDFGSVLLISDICGSCQITRDPEDQVVGVDAAALFGIRSANVQQQQWQVNRGTAFENVSNDALYSGVNSDTLRIMMASYNMAGYQYRCIIKNPVNTDTSKAAVLTVQDKVKPDIISIPDDQILKAGAECQISLPDYTGELVVTDNYDTDPEIIQNPPPGTTVSRSNFEVIITATDDDGNKAQKSFFVHSVDETPPVISAVPGDQTLAANSGCKASLPNYTAMVATSDNCSRGNELEITQTPAPYSPVSDTANEVILKVTDAEGNSSDTSFRVDVTDQTKPTLQCPEDQNIELKLEQTAYTVSESEFDPVSVEDNCAVDSIINNYNNSSTLAGAEFPPDTTTLVWTATDKAGNKRQCNFDIVVKTSTGMTSLAHSGIRIYPNPTGGKLHYESNNIPIQKIKLLDLTGNKIIELKDTDAKGTIDIAHLTSGIYFIQLSTRDSRWTSKIIKE
jgi:hypothetical protein